MQYFTLSAGSNTDLWRKPPNEDTLTAPIVFASLQRPFIVAEVTISAEWEMEGDQGGLVIFAGDAPTQSLPSCKWVKAGMEFSSGMVNITSVSATSDGADWCSLPLAMSIIPPLRIKLERVGYSLWIWYQILSLSPDAVTPEAVASTWKKLRQVTGFFYGVEDKSVHAGVYASRPTSIQQGGMEAMQIDDLSMVGGGDRLVVEFEDLEIFH
jgi:regulation of enolase protein 1 (concanavalin A-like superfamily)